ncbi:MAG: hypothetical protein H6585_15280 [Flavobacteriales bacterium]|nr:hypothetical protein [Flavobacteriales bacterium]MCB9449693.1 hypothetical protein [Flavobacteriales bacterium]
MKAITRFILIIPMLASLVLTSCQNSSNLMFPSRKGIEKKISAGKYERVDLGNVGNTEEWVFKDGMVYITETTGAKAGTITDSSTYIIQAGLTRAYISFFDFSKFWLNERFRIMRLNKDEMVLYYRSGTQGPYTAEFVKTE